MEYSKKGPYGIQCRILVPDKDGVITKNNPVIILQSTFKDYKRPHVRLEFNPDKLFTPTILSGSGAIDKTMAYLDAVFTEIGGMGFFDFISHGKVTKLDTCVDIDDRSPEDYIFKSRYSKSNQNIFDKDGRLGTVYMGKKSSTQYIAYNKAKELYGDNTDKNILRIEVSHKPNIMVTDLIHAKNMFKNLSVYSLESDAPPIETGYWLAFKDSCRFRGAKDALKQQPLQIRKILKAFLPEQTVPWWGFDDCWKTEWEKTLKQSALFGIQKSPYDLNLGSVAGN